MRDSELLERLRVLGGLWANLAAARIEALIAERDGLIQTSAALCDGCGWSMRFPDCGCVYCGFHRLEAERDALIAERDALASEAKRR
jgi:hypothetical protein